MQDRTQNTTSTSGTEFILQIVGFFAAVVLGAMQVNCFAFARVAPYAHGIGLLIFLPAVRAVLRGLPMTRPLPGLVLPTVRALSLVMVVGITGIGCYLAGNVLVCDLVFLSSFRSVSFSTRLVGVEYGGSRGCRGRVIFLEPTRRETLSWCADSFLRNPLAGELIRFHINAGRFGTRILSASRAQ